MAAACGGMASTPPLKTKAAQRQLHHAATQRDGDVELQQGIHVRNNAGAAQRAASTGQANRRRQRALGHAGSNINTTAAVAVPARLQAATAASAAGQCARQVCRMHAATQQTRRS
eukprot:13582190-Alexandrium_andersonii.AAC.1